LVVIAYPAGEKLMASSADDFSQEAPAPASPGTVTPNPSSPKTIGILNIIFASLLLLCGGCYATQIMLQPLMAPMMNAQQQQMQAAVEAQRQAEIQKLQQQEKAAKTAQEKAQFQSRQNALAAQPVPKMPDMTKMYGMGDNRVRGYFLIDLLSMLPLNLVMLIAGIGLLNLKEWARATGIWVAALKIVRLIALYSFFILVIAPIWTRAMVDMVQEMVQAAPGGPNQQQVGTLGTIYGVVMAVCGIAMMVLGSIYPAISLWVLSRPGTKAACTLPTPPPEQYESSAI
jgi:hypothetical protein